MTNQLAPSHLGLPPPAQWTLYDAGRAVGWTTENTVGFLGFSDQTEAVHAAWVAYRALTRRLARDEGTPPIPIDGAALTVQRRGGREVILADARTIATIVRLGKQSRSEADSFGFEVEIPPPANELRLRAMAHLMYRTLRKSGLRWALWRPAARDRVPSARHQSSEPMWRKPVTPSAWMGLGLASLSLLVLALVVPKGLGAALTVTGLAALATFRVAAMTGRWTPRRLTGQRETGS